MELGMIYVTSLYKMRFLLFIFSATVPNTLEFANWVGQTKKRKVYVSSTLYRPVPLQHYLYTGNGGKSRDENFLVVNQKGDFLLKGHSGNFTLFFLLIPSNDNFVLQTL